MIAYGPVPSRRLGLSLGINNIPPKSCSYACAYCQVGSTKKMAIQRREFLSPRRILEAVDARLEEVRAAGESVDYLSFVPDGEPTLDLNLGGLIEELKGRGIPVAVITNSSLLDQAQVRQELGEADWVSLKVDAVDERSWRRLNHPHRQLRLSRILEGMRRFREEFTGKLVTETMLVAGVNETTEHAEALSVFLASLKPDRAYLSIPTRPPTARWVHSPAPESLVAVYDRIITAVPDAEILVGYEGNAFSTAGAPRRSLLDITAVHPMRAEAVKELLEKTGTSWELVEELLDEGLLWATEYNGFEYYLRRPRSW